MALGISSGIRSYFGPKLSKQSTSNVSSLSTIELSEKKAREDQGLVDVLKESNTQSGSRFLHILPFEIRQIIYDYVWDAHGRQYHIHLRNGRLIHARCVMNHRDDDLDFIQKEMDRIHGSEHFDEFRNDRLRMWYRRLVSPWGRRHWRCKERLNYANLQKDGCRSVDETSWVNLMLVCKRMYPEVMESIFQFHRFIFNDIPSAQKFFILRPSPFIAHLRHLDLTLSAPMLEYSPFVDEDEHKSSCLLAISQVLANAIYLHDLRLSFDVWDRQFWTQIPEKVLLKEFGKLNAGAERGLSLQDPAALNTALLVISALR
ncbi:hypothetical protein BJ170DRAFT_591924 [Xylariales sp. AK1849]|nr:hypothetical protein BJ170DRAFT_591924 [Xylariales sp. AK1849]